MDFEGPELEYKSLQQPVKYQESVVRRVNILKKCNAET